MESIEQSEYYAELAEEVIREQRSLMWIRDSGLTIGYLVSDREKKSRGKTVYATCTKVKPLYSIFIPYDFLIVIYENAVAGFTRDQQKILLHHELLHVGMQGGKSILNPHDIEEFQEILRGYGNNWAEVNQEAMQDAQTGETGSDRNASGGIQPEP